MLVILEELPAYCFFQSRSVLLWDVILGLPVQSTWKKQTGLFQRTAAMQLKKYLYFFIEFQHLTVPYLYTLLTWCALLKIC